MSVIVDQPSPKAPRLALALPHDQLLNKPPIKPACPKVGGHVDRKGRPARVQQARKPTGRFELVEAAQETLLAHGRERRGHDLSSAPALVLAPHEARKISRRLWRVRTPKHVGEEHPEGNLDSNPGGLLGWCSGAAVDASFGIIHKGLQLPVWQTKLARQLRSRYIATVGERNDNVVPPVVLLLSRRCPPDIAGLVIAIPVRPTIEGMPG